MIKMNIKNTTVKKERGNDMSAETYIDFWGVLAALSFAGMMGAFLWRMIKISSPFRIVVPRVPGSPQRILVPIADILSAERGIDLARRLRENLKTEVRLLHVIEVPMTLPLEASLPQEETKAREIFRRGESLANLWGNF